MIIIYEVKEFKNYINNDNGNELPSINSTGKLIEDIHRNAIISEVSNNKNIQDKIIEQAKKTVDNELNTLDQETIIRRQKITYDANKEACLMYGINEHVPLWQIKLMRVGTGFWFILYWIFSTLTIVPLNVFFKGIKTFIKNNFIVFILSVLCYLIIVVGIPLLISLTK